MNLPKEADSLDLESVFAKRVFISPEDFLSMWMTREPSFDSRQDCLQSSNGKMNDVLLHESCENAKFALAAYAMPFYFQLIPIRAHLSNPQFMHEFVTLNSNPHFQELIFEHMNKILCGDIRALTLPNNAQMAGFYIRTPVRMWDANLKRVYDVPPWKSIHELNDRFILGCNNVYVMKQYDGCIRILFRGTSNEFNASPQYGNNLARTQLFHIPDFHMETQTFHKEGSDEIPLFYVYYWMMVKDMLPYIMECIRILGGIEQCKKCIVTGHSMGGGLSVTFAYLLMVQYPEWFAKCYFRQYAAPYCCNDVAAFEMNKAISRSKQRYKMIEVVNNDDFVNCQYLFGGKRGFETSLEAGTSAVLAFLIENGFKRNNQVENTLRSIQIDPDNVLSIFLNRASAKQSRFALDPTHPTRPGIKYTDKETSVVVFCTRKLVSNKEYLGKAHDEYMDLNMGLFWTILRTYENALYKRISERGLRSTNHLIVLPIFMENDLSKIDTESFANLQWTPSTRFMTDYFQSIT